MNERWVRWWFRGAAVYGVAVLVPLYFVPPPAPAGSEFYYGFLGMALLFQGLFWWIGGSPGQRRPFMLVAMLEKAAFAVPVGLLLMSGHDLPLGTMIGGGVDALLGGGFLVAYRATA